MWPFSWMPCMSIQRPATGSGDIGEAAIVAVGSNLPGRFGPPERMARRALSALRRLSARPPSCSSLYRTSPRNCAPGAPDFVNAAAALWPPPELTPESLLAELLRIEIEFGRRRDTVRNAPRTLDLDLIAWGARAVHCPELQLPHPRLAEREFVLAPLAELAPDWIPPGRTRSVAELLEALPGRKDPRIIRDSRFRN